MSFCPVPHTTRDFAWLGVGIVTGACVARALHKRRSKPERCTVSITTPTRIFKLARADDLASFRATGCIESALDKIDGFVHLSDRTAPPKVASLFFKGAADLHLLEIDVAKLMGPVHWFVGVMGDRPPDETMRAVSGKTAVHYLMSDGCVHVFSDSGVSAQAIVREAHCPLGPDGKHVFPDWL